MSNIYQVTTNLLKRAQGGVRRQICDTYAGFVDFVKKETYPP